MIQGGPYLEMTKTKLKLVRIAMVWDKQIERDIFLEKWHVNHLLRLAVGENWIFLGQAKANTTTLRSDYKGFDYKVFFKLSTEALFSDDVIVTT